MAWSLPTLPHPCPSPESPPSGLAAGKPTSFPLGILIAHSFTSSGLLHGVFSDHLISITSLLSCLFFPALIYSQHKPLSEKQRFMSLQASVFCLSFLLPLESKLHKGALSVALCLWSPSSQKRVWHQPAKQLLSE